MKIGAAEEKFILHWGEMGTRWGINRTVAQIHALLFLSDRPLHAEEIMEALGVARSNVSNSLKELQAWGIVKLTHIRGDKRDHFESIKDVWEMFRLIIDERKRREVDPTLDLLRECLAEAEKNKSNKQTQDRLKSLLSFFETTSAWFDQARKWPTAILVRLFTLGDKILKFIS